MIFLESKLKEGTFFFEAENVHMKKNIYCTNIQIQVDLNDFQVIFPVCMTPTPLLLV